MNEVSEVLPQDLHRVAAFVDAQMILRDSLKVLESEFPIQVNAARVLICGPSETKKTQLDIEEKRLLETQGLSRSVAEARAFWKAHYVLVISRRIASEYGTDVTLMSERVEKIFATIDKGNWGFE